MPLEGFYATIIFELGVTIFSWVKKNNQDGIINTEMEITHGYTYQKQQNRLWKTDFSILWKETKYHAYPVVGAM